MAISQSPTDPRYRCPECDGDLAARHDSFVCDDCGFTPRHGAD